jgi:hypothetical protein
MGGGNLEYNRCFLVCKGCLNDQLVGECITPWKINADFRKAQFEQFELSEVFVK